MRVGASESRGGGEVGSRDVGRRGWKWASGGVDGIGHRVDGIGHRMELGIEWIDAWIEWVPSITKENDAEIP